MNCHEATIQYMYCYCPLSRAATCTHCTSSDPAAASTWPERAPRPVLLPCQDGSLQSTAHTHTHNSSNKHHMCAQCVRRSRGTAGTRQRESTHTHEATVQCCCSHCPLSPMLQHALTGYVQTLQLRQRGQRGRQGLCCSFLAKLVLYNPPHTYTHTTATNTHIHTHPATCVPNA